jgi:hypothetical protein
VEELRHCATASDQRALARDPGAIQQNSNRLGSLSSSHTTPLENEADEREVSRTLDE